MGKCRSALCECRHPARQVLWQNGSFGLHSGARCASHGYLLLLQGSVGWHARAQLWPYRRDDVVVRFVRKLWTSQLRRHTHTHTPAKAGMGGLMNVLAEEAPKNNIRVNTISPTAATRMTEELLPPQSLALMKPEAITPAVLYLLGADAPTRTVMGAGAGSFAVIKIIESEGINLPQSKWTPEAVSAQFGEISDMSKAKALESAFQQTQKYITQASAKAGINLK